MPARSRSLLRRTPYAKSSDEALRGAGPQIAEIRTSAYQIPTDAPESDGTLQWDGTTMVLVEISAGGETGLGYSYCSAAAVEIIHATLAERLKGTDAFSIPRLWEVMVGAVRNVGWRGVAANAISAVDIALWDLKAKLLELPLGELFGRAQDRSRSLWQRRLHLLRQFAAGGTIGALGQRAGLPCRQNENRAKA